MSRLAVVIGALSLGCVGAECFGQTGAETDRATRIQEAHFVELGGIQQWITMRGDDSRDPVLLFLHGGPGDVQSPLVSIYAPYESDFVLVQWDQRGADRTYGGYGDETPDP